MRQVALRSILIISLLLVSGTTATAAPLYNRVCGTVTCAANYCAQVLHTTLGEIRITWGYTKGSFRVLSYACRKPVLTVSRVKWLGYACVAAGGKELWATAYKSGCY